MAAGDDATAEPTRTAYNSCAAKVSMGPAGRVNFDLGAKYADEAPLGNALTENTYDYTAELKNICFGLFGAGVRLGAAAGLTQLDVISDPSADKDTQIYKLSGGLDLGSWSYDAVYSEKKELDAG
jgi:hypothetical protein